MSRFWNPTGIALFEETKTLYVSSPPPGGHLLHLTVLRHQVSDKNNHRIRKIDPLTGWVPLTMHQVKLKEVRAGVAEACAGSGVPGFRDSNKSSEAQFK